MPNKLFTVEDARQLAFKRLPKSIFDFIDGAAGDESLRDLNAEAINKIRLMPRVLVDVSLRSLSHNFLGTEYGRPFGIAPMGMCNLAWPKSDEYLAKAAALRRIPLGVSTASSSTLEKMIEMAEGYAWFQLYVDQSLEFVNELISRAKAANYSVMILTVDVPIPSRRIRDLKNDFSYPMHWTPKKLLSFASCPRWSINMLIELFCGNIPRPMNYFSSRTDVKFHRNAGRTGSTWEFLQRLRDGWHGKLIVKGVQCPEDAINIKNLGVDSIYVSNHGGRQLNSAPTVVDSIESMRNVLGNDFPLIYDGSIRNGEHVVKAMALGANFVMLGRSVMYGLGAGANRGLSNILDNIENETKTSMGLVGCCGPYEIGQESLAENHYIVKAK